MGAGLKSCPVSWAASLPPLPAPREPAVQPRQEREQVLSSSERFGNHRQACGPSPSQRGPPTLNKENECVSVSLL